MTLQLFPLSWKSSFLYCHYSDSCVSFSHVLVTVYFLLPSIYYPLRVIFWSCIYIAATKSLNSIEAFESSKPIYIQLPAAYLYMDLSKTSLIEPIEINSTMLLYICLYPVFSILACPLFNWRILSLIFIFPPFTVSNSTWNPVVHT